MGRGGEGGGLSSQVLPLQKGKGDGKSFSHAEEGGGTFGGSFNFVHLSISHTELGEGGRERKFPPLTRRGGHGKYYPVLRWGTTSFGPVIFQFCSPSPCP